MARMARVVVPGEPLQVTQRGVRRMETFFEEADYRAYLEVLAEACTRTGVACWAYCLVPNHGHLILMPTLAPRPPPPPRPTAKKPSGGRHGGIAGENR